MSTIPGVPGVRTGNVSDLRPLGAGRSCQLLTALARGAEALTSGKGWPDGVSDLIADLGRILGVNRVWLFQVLELTDNHMLMSFPFEWVDSETHALKTMSRYDTKHWDFDTCSRTYRELVQSRRRGEWQTAIIKDLDDGDFKTYQMEQGVQSTVSIPVMVEGQWWGLLGLDDCTRPYQWSDEDIALVRMAAHLISSAVLSNRLMSAHRQFEILSNLTESSAWELDVNSGYCWCDSRILSSAGGPGENVHLSLFQMLRRIHPGDRGKIFSYLRRRIQQRSPDFRKDLRLLRDSTHVWREVIAKISWDKEGRLIKLAGIIVDIPERKEKEERLRRKASRDSLTGIANRAAFDQHFIRSVRALKSGGTVFSLLLLDIDHFKRVNDTWGHGVGDQALKHVTQILQTVLRKGDFVARIGGEEFVMLLHGALPETGAVAERIRSEIEAAPLVSPKGVVPLTVSIGIFNASKAALHLDRAAMLNHADQALYSAKNRGRNRVVTSGKGASSNG